MGSAFGERLRSLREAQNLTLQQVADAAGCTKAYIWELEKKPGQRPSAERIQAIAKVLAFGALKGATRRKLEDIGATGILPARLRRDADRLLPGTVLTRSFGDTEHRVLVRGMRDYEYNGHGRLSGPAISPGLTD